MPSVPVVKKPALPPVRYEAERSSTIFTGNSIVANHADASDGKAVVNNYQVGDSLTLTSCPAAEVISVRFAKGSEGDGVLSFYVNQKHTKDIKFPNTGGWDKYQEMAIEIDIPNNAKIMFRCDEGDLSTNIDCVDFYENGLGSLTIPIIVTDPMTGLKFDKTTGTITGYTGTATSLIIPSTINGVEVVCIGYEAFYREKSLTSVEIPNTVKKNDSRAFINVKSLNSITIPTSVESFGNNAFYGTPWLAKQKDEFFIVNNVLISYNGSGANATIPNGVKTIGASSFAAKTDLKSITIPISVTEIGEGAFQDCWSISSLSIPDSVKIIGNGAFSNCDELTTVKLPKDITFIGDQMFSRCLKLKSITIPKGVVSIGSDAFDSCGELTSLIIPDGVVSIGADAFLYCEKLSYITIPKSVIKIGKGAFFGCLWFEKNTDPLVIINDTVYGYVGTEKEVTVPSGVTRIAEFAFNSTPVVSVILPNTVKVIEDSAFSYTGLTSIYLPDSIESIGDNAFYNAELTSLVLPKNLKHLGYEAFGGAKGTDILTGIAHNVIDEVIIPPSLTDIGLGFKDAKIKKITIPGTVKVIPDNAFYNAWQIEEVIIEDGVTSIGSNAFYDCQSLEKITIPEGVTSIGSKAFFRCIHLKKITIPKSVISIPQDVFDGCRELNK